MEPRFSPEIAGIEPLTFEAARQCPAIPLIQWVDGIARGRRDPGPAPAIAALSRDDCRTLRLRVTQALETNATVSAAWSGVYSVLSKHAGSLSGNVESGGPLGRGPFWVEIVFANTRMAPGPEPVASDYARLAFLNDALDEISSPHGARAWAERLLSSPALQPWDSAQADHWMLRLLDCWQLHGGLLALQPASADTRQRQQVVDLAFGCVQKLDGLLSCFEQAGPSMWRQLARQVEHRLACLSGQAPRLPGVASCPVHVPIGERWANPRICRAPAWRTQPCMLLEWLKLEYTWPKLRKAKSPKPPKLLDGLLDNDRRRQEIMDRVAGLIRATPRDQHSCIHASLPAFSRYAARHGAPALAVEPERLLLEAATPAAPSSRRSGMRL